MRKIFLLVLLVAFQCLLFGQNSKKTTNEKASGNKNTGYCNVKGGKLYYEEQGTGMPLIMIHAGMLDSRMWEDQVAAFSKQYRVITYDARRHGRSQTDSVSFSHVDDLAALMDCLSIKKAVILGLSLGGYVIIDFALAYPEKVIGLIPVSPGLTGYDFKDPQVMEYREKMKTCQTWEQVVECMLRPWFDGPQRMPGQADTLIRKKAMAMYMENLKNFPRGLKEVLSDPPAIKRLSEIRKPVLVVVGDLDQPGILEIAGMMEKQIPGAKKTVIKGAAHLVSMEKPEEFNRVVMAFLATLRN